MYKEKYKKKIISLTLFSTFFRGFVLLIVLETLVLVVLVFEAEIRLLADSFICFSVSGALTDNLVVVKVLFGFVDDIVIFAFGAALDKAGFDATSVLGFVLA